VKRESNDKEPTERGPHGFKIWDTPGESGWPVPVIASERERVAAHSKVSNAGSSPSHTAADAYCLHRSIFSVSILHLLTHLHSPSSLRAWPGGPKQYE